MKLKLSPEEREYFRRQGRKGGKLSAAARMEKLTAQQRSEIARIAVAAREAKREAAKREAAKPKAAKAAPKQRA
jgi:hypothetical protein